MISTRPISNGMDTDVTIELGVDPELVPAATELYCEAFQDKLAPFLGDKERAARFLASGVVPDRAFVALRDGQVVGIAGFKVDGKGLYEPGLVMFLREYGWSAPARLFGLLMLERAERPDMLLMDGIAVSETVRGKGIGTRLLQAIEDHARRLGKRSIRLDVIDTNPGARRLYERFGFKARKTSGVGLLKHVFAFRTSTDMRKQLV